MKIFINATVFIDAITMLTLCSDITFVLIYFESIYFYTFHSIEITLNNIIYNIYFRKMSNNIF